MCDKQCTEKGLPWGLPGVPLPGVKTAAAKRDMTSLTDAGGDPGCLLKMEATVLPPGVWQGVGEGSHPHSGVSRGVKRLGHQSRGGTACVASLHTLQT